mmetsp:Transcript_13325/g.31731  ORF Transcript_13325/g.31731 Transcript_13325/m.31731 type:complete len:223 (-) Transcript_13325:79-747(-)
MARPIVGPASIKRLGLNSLASGLVLASASSLLDFAPLDAPSRSAVRWAVFRSSSDARSRWLPGSVLLPGLSGRGLGIEDSGAACTAAAATVARSVRVTFLRLPPELESLPLRCSPPDASCCRRAAAAASAISWLADVCWTSSSSSDSSWCNSSRGSRSSANNSSRGTLPLVAKEASTVYALWILSCRNPTRRAVETFDSYTLKEHLFHLKSEEPMAQSLGSN